MAEGKRSPPRVLSLINDIVPIVGGIIIVAVAFVVLLQVLARFVFATPLSWVEEVAVWSVIVSVFISLFLFESEDSYLKVDIILNRLPKSVSLVIHILSKLLLLVTSIFLLNGQRLAYSFLVIAETQGGSISLLWFHTPIAIGLLLWAVYVVYSLWDYCTDYLRKKPMNQ